MKSIICLLLSLFFSTLVHTQQVFDVVPTGTWLSRMTTAERQNLPNPSNGQMVFDLGLMTPCFYVSSTGKWRCLLSTVPDVDQVNFGGNLPFMEGGFNGHPQSNVVHYGDGSILVQSNTAGNRYGYKAQVATAGKAFEVSVRVKSFTGVNAILNLNSSGTTSFSSFVELAIEGQDLKVYASGLTPYIAQNTINYYGSESILKVVGTAVSNGRRNIHFYINGQHIHKILNSTILTTNVDLLLYGWNGDVHYSDFHHSEAATIPVNRTTTAIASEQAGVVFADPFLMNDTGPNYYCFATNANSSKHIQVKSTTDFLNYTTYPDALPGFPAWSSGNPNYFWAPGAKKFGNQYVLYYVNQSSTTKQKPNGSTYNVMGIGVATSSTPQGPYTHVGNNPLILRPDVWGAIDPEPFTDPITEKTYLLWKSDANAVGGITQLFAVELSANGLSIVGQHYLLMSFQQGATEDVLIENPSIYFNEQNAKYYMIYSSHYWDNDNYNTGVAVSDNLLGPYTRLYNGAMLSKGHASNLKGPGGGSFFKTNGNDLGIIFHGRNGNGNQREFYIGDVEFDASGVPHVLPATGAGFEID